MKRTLSIAIDAGLLSIAVTLCAFLLGYAVWSVFIWLPLFKEYGLDDWPVGSSRFAGWTLTLVKILSVVVGVWFCVWYWRRKTNGNYPPMASDGTGPLSAEMHRTPMDRG
jgi:hypothetical protein